MSPSNDTLLSTRESTSHLQKNSAKKRSLFTSRADCDVSNDDINYKRKKFDAHSQKDINHAVQTTSNGYMTRNRLKHELKENNVTEPSVIKKKSSKNEESTKNLRKAKRTKKPAKETLKKKLQLGYVFTSDIFLQYPELQQDTQLKKNTPSLFESDSEQESRIDCILINNHTDEVESKSISILKPEFICPTLHKNSGVKTYFNKKSCSSNNKLNVISPKMVESSHKIENSSNLSNHINFNVKINETSEISSFNNTMNSIEKKNNDENTMIVTNDFIKHLDQELRMENINCSQANQNYICMIDNIVDNKCSINSSSSNSSLEQKVNSNNLIDTESLEFETTQVTENKFSSIFDIPKTEDTLVQKEANLNLNCTNENYIYSLLSKTPKNTHEVYDSVNDFENGTSVDQNNLCMINDFVNDECSSSNSLLEQKVNSNELMDSDTLAFETTRVNENNFSSIFDTPKAENTPVIEEANLNLNFTNENCISSPSFNNTKKTVEVYDSLTNDFENAASDQSIDNHFNELKNTDFSSQINERQISELPNFVTHKYFNSIDYNDRKRKSETLLSETENDNSSFIVDNSSKKSKNEQSNPKCHCKIFYSFNINANMKLTSKPNHFVLNTYAEKLRQKVLHQKYLEANILDTLIRKDSNNIKSEKLTPTSNTIFTNLNYEKKVHVIENDHIKPTILSMLKDVHVDLDYVSEYCESNKDDTSVGLQTIDKNVQISKSINKITATNESMDTFIPHDKNYIDFGEQKNTNSCITKKNESTSFKSYDHKIIGLSKNKKSNNDIVSNITSVDKPPFYLKPCEKINVDSDEQNKIPLPIESNIQDNVFDLLKPPVYGNCFDSTTSSIKDKNIHIFSALPHESQQANNSLFNLSNNDIENSLGNSSSDDDTKLKIDDEDNINHKVPKSPELVCSMDNLKDLTVNDEQTDNLKDSIVNDNNLSSVKNVEFCEIKSIDSRKEQHFKIRIVNDDRVLKPIVLNEEVSNNKYENLNMLKEENNSLTNCMVMTIEECNDFYRNKSLNNSTTYTNTIFSNEINYIFKEMYVNDIFVSSCQHMVETCEDETLFQTVSNHKLQSVNKPIEREVNDIKTKNDDSNIYPAFGKSIPPTDAEIISKTEVDNSYQKHNETSISSIKEINSNSPQKAKNDKSNIKIRIIFRNLINSNKMMNEILESKEFRNLRFFEEEEIACSIGVLIFEAKIDPPIITGLSAYQVNYDQLGDEEKNKILGSANLSIICPKIMKLTTITLALVKMLRSNKLIDLILNAIRKNLLNKKMNTNHTVDDQIMKQTVYFIDICVRLRLLKTLQTFIFDSMVLLPNKYCCIIFISLLLWKNCLPRRVNNERDPVLITVMSYLIAKKKVYSEQIVGRDIFQRELINLLSFHFNYSFVTDMPYNFIQHVNKPDFSISVVMFLKCCNPKDSSEFIVNCLFPIIEDYLNSQENENNAIQVMESIHMATRPFKITCNSTVAIYLNKCKSAISGIKKDDKEHIYNTTYTSYRILQNKFVEYLYDTRPRSQLFEESLISIIMVLGSVDYATSCVPLMKWNPKFPLSTILSKKFNMFKSIIGHPLWDKLCVMNDTNVIKCLVNSCVLKKDVYNTILQIHSQH